MPRKKSTDTPEVKALRKLLLSLGLSTVTVGRLVTRMDGQLTDLSAKACDVQLYIAGHPEIKRPSDYAARTLLNFVDQQEAQRQAPTTDDHRQPLPSATMELWGEED